MHAPCASRTAICGGSSWDGDEDEERLREAEESSIKAIRESERRGRRGRERKREGERERERKGDTGYEEASRGINGGGTGQSHVKKRMRVRGTEVP